MRRALALACILVASPVPLEAQAAWTRVYPVQSPPARSAPLMECFEPLGRTLLLFGRAGSGATIADSWQYDGTTWTQVTAALPPARDGGAMVYDSSRQRIVLFGGLGGSFLNDTWEWDGAVWLNRNPNVRPAPRANQGMAFDRRRGVTVLFSGSGGPVVYHQDMWEWNGAAWTQRTPASLPAGRETCLMSFDPSTGKVLMTGGVNNGVPFLQTWSWDGTNWLLLQPATPPLPHLGGRLVADIHRCRVVLSGDDTDMFAWEWDGAQWTIRLQISPGPRILPGMAYDPVHRSTVLFGGTYNSVLDDTWIFRTPNPADVVAYGTGCAGPAGLPQLANAPYSYPWLGDTFTSRVTRQTPAAFAVFVTGLQSTAPISLAPVGMPGCSQLVAPTVSELRFAAGGTVDWSIVIPTTPSLLGVSLFQQAFTPDQPANALGLTASNGIQMTTGIR